MKKSLIILSLILLSFACAPSAGAVTYWVAKTGNNSNACSAIDGDADPGVYRLTINAGISCMAAGDTLIIKAGTYSEVIGQDGSAGYPPSGTSWNTATTIKRNGSDTVTVNGTTSLGPLTFYSSSVGYIIFDGIIFENRRTGPNGSPVLFGNGTHHIRLTNCEAKGGESTGGISIFESPDVEVINCYVHSNGLDDQLDHGIYSSSARTILRGNTVANNAAWGIQVFTGSADVDGSTIENNRVFGNGAGGMVLSDMANLGTRPVVRGNIIYENGIAGSGSDKAGIYVQSTSDIAIYNNTIVGNALYGYWRASGSNDTLKNNIFYQNTNGDINGSPTTSSNNWLNADGNPNFVNLGGDDYALQASSGAINAGTSSIVSGITRAFNGSNPDIGAHETFTLASVSPPSCSVESGDASTLRLIFTNNVNPPIAGVSTAGFTYRINTGAANTANAAALNGTNNIYLTLQAAVTAGQTVDFSYTTSGSVRDSANIGGTTGGLSSNQRLNAITNQSCTNNVGGGAPSNLTVSHFRFHNLRSSSTTSPESARYVLAATDVDTTVKAGATFGLRTKIKCTTGDCEATGFNLRYQKNGGGGYANIPDTCGADFLAFFGTSNTSADIPAQGTATTEQLTSDHATNVAGAIVRTSSAVPNIDLVQDSETEMEHLLTFCTGASVGAFYDFRPYKQDGTALDAYTFTPRLTITNARFLQ